MTSGVGRGARPGDLVMRHSSGARRRGPVKPAVEKIVLTARPGPGPTPAPSSLRSSPSMWDSWVDLGATDTGGGVAVDDVGSFGGFLAADHHVDH